MKAYYVTSPCEEFGAIVFAESRGKARSTGQFALGQWVHVDFIDIRPQRRPQFDQFASTGVPVSALIADGWMWDCSGCGRRTWAEDIAKVNDELREVVCVECEGAT